MGRKLSSTSKFLCIVIAIVMMLFIHVAVGTITSKPVESPEVIKIVPLEDESPSNEDIYRDAINRARSESDQLELSDVECLSSVSEALVTYTYYNMTADDIYLFATVVFLEGGAESYECQQAIASVILNRMTTSGDSLEDVIYAENQFEVVPRIPYSSPSESSMDAVKYVLEYGPTVPEYVLYFRAGYYHNWADTIGDYMCIDNTYFSYNAELMEELS